MYGEISAIVSEREQTHGDFIITGAIAHGFKQIFRGPYNWEHLSPVQREALDMVASKIARILSGNPNHADHWDDIAGYASLVAENLKQKERAN